MSNTMLCGVLRMPEHLLEDPLVRSQFIAAARQAADEIERGRGRYPEWSDEMASLARRMVVWAGEMRKDGDA
jgi:hypothetical protein